MVVDGTSRHPSRAPFRTERKPTRAAEASETQMVVMYISFRSLFYLCILDYFHVNHIHPSVFYPFNPFPIFITSQPARKAFHHNNPAAANKAPTTTPKALSEFLTPLAGTAVPVALVLVLEVLGKIPPQVTPGAQLVGPFVPVQVVVCPVQVTLAGHTVTVFVPPGSTHVHVGSATQGNGPKEPVQVSVWPVQVEELGQVVRVVMEVTVMTVTEAEELELLELLEEDLLELPEDEDELEEDEDELEEDWEDPVSVGVD